MAQSALSSAQLIAGEYGQQQIDNEHLLVALVRQENGVVPQLLKKLNIDVVTFQHEAENLLAKKPKVTGPGAGGNVYISNRLNGLLSLADSEAALEE
jgi:ATP-dependent Clp protease ATP-binding subunit ClpB